MFLLSSVFLFRTSDKRGLVFTVVSLLFSGALGGVEPFDGVVELDGVASFDGLVEFDGKVAFVGVASFFGAAAFDGVVSLEGERAGSGINVLTDIVCVS